MDYLYSVSRGIDDRPVEPWSGPPESVGSETTFREDTRDPETVMRVVRELVEDVHPELEEEGLVYRTVGIKVRFDDFETRTRARTLRVYTREREPIGEVAQVLLREFLEDGRKIRLVGVRLSNLKYGEPASPTLSRFAAGPRPDEQPQG